MRCFLSILIIVTAQYAGAAVLYVGKGFPLRSIKDAISRSASGDTVIVRGGYYKEGNIIIDKSLTFLGQDLPVLDGEKKYEVLSVKASHVTIKGFKIQYSGHASLDDPCGIKVYDSDNILIADNVLYDNFFGIYIQYGKHCIIRNNTIVAFGKEEQLTGNGIHCWKSDNLQIIANTIRGHRDGIYFEFVTHSLIWRNHSLHNIRYGLHFMFSNNDAYFTNIFEHNGAGVSVMFTRHVTMMNNTFSHNWGDAAYGLLLKEISDSYISGNRFTRNTSGIFMEGTSRIRVERNVFEQNGWGMKIQASCMDNEIENNNFISNTFDISTNGSLVLNTFNNNYWDKYEGYDLDKDSTGDVPYHPLSLFSVIIEINPAVMLLYRSFMVTLLDRSEKVIPSLTPGNFIDNHPKMKPWKL